MDKWVQLKTIMNIAGPNEPVNTVEIPIWVNQDRIDAFWEYPPGFTMPRVFNKEFKIKGSAESNVNLLTK